MSVCLIGGCGSSGTTLLAHLLDGIQDIRCSPEAYVFHHRLLYRTENFKRELYRALAQLSPKWTYDIDGWKFPLIHPMFISGRAFFGMNTVYDEYALLATSGSMVDMIDWLRQKLVETHQFPPHFLWVDQTPKNVIGAEAFLNSVPNGRFVHLIRDGRDVVASLAKRYALEFPGKSRETYLKVGALRWCVDVSHGLQARQHPGYLEIRYEDLTAAPLQWINAILRHLGREPIDGMVLKSKKSYAAETFPQLFLGGSKPSWGANPAEAVSTRSVGKWRKALEAKEVEDLMALSFQIKSGTNPLRLRDLLAALGYLA